MNEPGITAIQMFQKVTAYVLKKTNNQQLPWVSTSLTGDFYLVPGSGKADNTQVLSTFIPEKEAADNERSVVVLPFKNLTGKQDQDYLVEGQHDALITELSKISQVKPLRVLSGQTAPVFANATRSIPDIAKEINVDYIIEGSVLNPGDSITLMLRLIRAFPEEKPVWAQTYTSNIQNVFKLYNNIAGQIAQKIDMGLSVQNLVILPAPRQINPETYKSYLRGMYNLKQGTPESIKKGFEYLNGAIKLDPADPFAYTALAHGYFETAHGTAAIDDAIDKGAAAAFRLLNWIQQWLRPTLLLVQHTFYHYGELMKLKNISGKPSVWTLTLPGLTFTMHGLCTLSGERMKL